MNKMKLVLLGLSVPLCLLTANANAANLVVNGDFESNTVLSGNYETFDSVSQGLVGWTIGLHNVDLVNNGLWDPAGGINSLDLNGLKKGEIHQTLNTTVGQLYQLSFDLAGNINGGPTVKYLSVNVGANGLYSFDTTGKSSNNMGWTHYVSDFYAVDKATTLSFLSNVTGNAGPALDNISVTAVPEPETYAMMLVGLGLMGFAARRRRAD